MNNQLSKRYLVLSFLLGVFVTLLATFYILNNKQSATTSATAPEEERTPVYLNSNDIVVQKAGKSLIFDGSQRTLPEELPLLQHGNEIYAPLKRLSEYLGISYTDAANGIVIGNFVSLEPIAFSNSVIPFSYIGSTFTREQMEAQLGEAVHEEQIMNTRTGYLETVVEYHGAVIHYSQDETEPKVLQIIVHEPIMMTHRGITIDSTRDEVLKKYGPPEPNSTDETWIYGEKYTLWFTFEDDRVVEFGNMQVKHEESAEQDTDPESSSHVHDDDTAQIDSTTNKTNKTEETNEDSGK